MEGKIIAGNVWKNYWLKRNNMKTIEQIKNDAREELNKQKTLEGQQAVALVQIVGILLDIRELLAKEKGDGNN